MTSEITDYRLQRFLAWSCLVVGIGLGLALGLWSFYGPLPVPAWLGEYDAVPRRLVRLAHIAWIALSVIHLLLLTELERGTLPRGVSLWAARLMAFGNVALPLTLIAAAAAPPLQYAMPIPALAIFVAVILGARAAIRREAR